MLLVTPGLFSTVTSKNIFFEKAVIFLFISILTDQISKIHIWLCNQNNKPFSFLWPEWSTVEIYNFLPFQIISDKK